VVVKISRASRRAGIGHHPGLSEAYFFTLTLSPIRTMRSAGKTHFWWRVIAGFLVVDVNRVAKRSLQAAVWQTLVIPTQQ
jgi:hypothetical protein